MRNNLVLQFKRDTIDQSPQLAEALFNRFGRDGELEFSRRVRLPTRDVARRRRAVRESRSRWVLILIVLVSGYVRCVQASLRFPQFAWLSLSIPTIRRKAQVGPRVTFGSNLPPPISP